MSRIIITAAIVAALACPSMAADEPSIVCMAAAQRVYKATVREAKGTRHEKQIADSVRNYGSDAKAVSGFALKIQKNNGKDSCGLIVAMSEDMITALAREALPELSE